MQATESGYMGYFVFEHLDADRSLYKEYTEDLFILQVEIEDELVEEFIKYAKDRNITIDFEPYKEALKKHLKATIAEQLFGINAAGRVRNQDDNMIRRVLELSINNEITQD